jgi:hypothetical protein
MFPLLHFLLPPGEENKGKGLYRGERRGFSFFGLDKESRVILYIQRLMQVGSTKGRESCSETQKRRAPSSRG